MLRGKSELVRVSASLSDSSRPALYSFSWKTTSFALS